MNSVRWSSNHQHLRSWNVFASPVKFACCLLRGLVPTATILSLFNNTKNIKYILECVAKPSLITAQPWNWSKRQSYFSPVVDQCTRSLQQAEACTGATSICLQPCNWLLTAYSLVFSKGWLRHKLRVLNLLVCLEWQEENRPNSGQQHQAQLHLDLALATSANN